MDRNTGSEDTSSNVERTREAAENRDALAEQARRTQATTPSTVNTTRHPTSTGAQGSEDNTENVEHVHEAEENRDALAEQARRTEATTPPEINTTGPPSPNQ